MPLFAKSKINLLDWPSRSPDLNPIENIWYLLERKIYENGQFRTKSELKTAIEAAVEDINLNRKKVIIDLIKGMGSRLVKVIEKKGNIINEKH